MKAVLNDMHDRSSSLDGATVHNRKELFRLLDSAQDREPFGCELVGENDFKLTLGIGQDIGFVQHSPSDGSTPYLMAVAREKCREQDHAEFLVGNTPTPVPRRYCIPFEAMKEIAAYFIETGERSPAVSWEEI